MGLANYIKQEWGVLTAAPATFFGGGALLLVATVTATFFVTSWSYDRQIATLDTIIQQKDDVIDQKDVVANELRRLVDDMRRDIDRRFVDQDRRIDGIEQKISDEQASALRDELSADPSSIRIGVGEGDDPLPQQLIDIFRESGWAVEPTNFPALQSGIMFAPDDPETIAFIEAAFRDAGIVFDVGDYTTGAIAPVSGIFIDESSITTLPNFNQPGGFERFDDEPLVPPQEQNDQQFQRLPAN